MELKFLCEPYHLSEDDSNSMDISQISSYEDCDLSLADVFLVGYKEDRNSDNLGCDLAADTIRHNLYALHKTSKPLRIVDLGNCRKGNTIEESYETLQQCLDTLASYKKPIIVFGGTQEAICYMTKASFQDVQFPSIALVDARIDINQNHIDFTNRNYLQKLYEENTKARLIHIANQEYLSSQESFAWLNEHDFPSCRLGECNSEIEKTEPLTRDVQIISMDLNAIRYSDSPAGMNVNGLYAEKSCQIAWNAGFSPRLNTFFLTEFNPQKDTDSISAQLSAEILWHVLDGISQRKKETVDFSDDIYLKRYLKHPHFPQDICFYESTISKMVWVEVPMGATKKYRIIPCSIDDYNTFNKGMIPDIWMMEYNRLLQFA